MTVTTQHMVLYEAISLSVNISIFHTEALKNCQHVAQPKTGGQVEFPINSIISSSSDKHWSTAGYCHHAPGSTVLLPFVAMKTIHLVKMSIMNYYHNP